MGRFRLTTGAVILSSIAAPSVHAQDNNRAVRSAFISSDLEYNDNYDLRSDSAGNALLWTTTLGFGLSTFTPVDRLDLSAQGSVRASDLPAIGEDVSADNPLVRLNYGRTIDDNSLSFGLVAQQADVDFFDPLSDVDVDGRFDDTTGDGTRRSLRANAGFTLNEDGPVSLGGYANASDIDYSDTTDADLNDRRRFDGGAQVGFRISPLLRFTTGGSYAREKYEDIDNLDRTTRRADVGLDAQINPALSLRSTLGYSRVESERDSGTTVEEGVVGGVSLVSLEKRGETRISADVDLDENGQRYTLSFGKLVNWDNASLNADIGVSTNEDTDLRFVGSVNYTLQGRDNELSLGLRQSATTDEDGRNVLYTSGRVSFIQLLTDVSSLGLSVDGGLTRFEDEASNDSERLNVVAQFNHALTRDWDMNMGYRYRQANSDRNGYRDSNAVFVGVSRDFLSPR